MGDKNQKLFVYYLFIELFSKRYVSDGVFDEILKTKSNIAIFKCSLSNLENRISKVNICEIAQKLGKMYLKKLVDKICDDHGKYSQKYINSRITIFLKQLEDIGEYDFVFKITKHFYSIYKSGDFEFYDFHDYFLDKCETDKQLFTEISNQLLDRNTDFLFEFLKIKSFRDEKIDLIKRYYEKNKELFFPNERENIEKGIKCECGNCVEIKLLCQFEDRSEFIFKDKNDLSHIYSIRKSFPNVFRITKHYVEFSPFNEISNFSDVVPITHQLLSDKYDNNLELMMKKFKEIFNDSYLLESYANYLEENHHDEEHYDLLALSLNSPGYHTRKFMYSTGTILSLHNHSLELSTVFLKKHLSTANWNDYLTIKKDAILDDVIDINMINLSCSYSFLLEQK